jgi:hypothetical protein
MFMPICFEILEYNMPIQDLSVVFKKKNWIKSTKILKNDNQL